jgi:hypothetical protein
MIIVQFTVYESTKKSRPTTEDIFPKKRTIKDMIIIKDATLKNRTIL